MPVASIWYVVKQMYYTFFLLFIRKTKCSVIQSMMNFYKTLKLQVFKNVNEKFELVSVNMYL